MGVLWRQLFLFAEVPTKNFSAGNGAFFPAVDSPSPSQSLHSRLSKCCVMYFNAFQKTQTNFMELSGQKEWKDFTGRAELLIWQ